VTDLSATATADEKPAADEQSPRPPIAQSTAMPN
jgi:hypothetical protein